ncbi:MAG: 3-deoxy-D-manno-octulosonic-acid transferase [Maribacter sp.]
MHFIYNVIVYASWSILQLIAKANTKLSLFVKGRKLSIPTLQKYISGSDSVIWVHAASLGEYEQGLPILEKLKTNYPSYKIVLTFFSPSGYEIKQHISAAHVTIYLPMDTKKKVAEFLDVTRPKLAIFIKYEIWPNYLAALDKRNIPTLLISALFKKEQIYFKPYGAFMRNALKTFDHFYVQDENSKSLLNSIGLTNCTVSGDTRMDRVSKILDSDNSLDFMDAFNTTENCLIAGSTWPEDEKLLVDYINRSPSDIKFVIAPHNIKKEHSHELKKSIDKPTLLYSEIETQNLENINVLIIDTIGILTKLYSYATIAYVGGGFATGLHNTAEPAVFGIPVIIGPEYKGFREAEALISLGGIISICTIAELTKHLNELTANKEKRNKVGRINATYITENKGASTKIMEGISKLL